MPVATMVVIMTAALMAPIVMPMIAVPVVMTIADNCLVPVAPVSSISCPHIGIMHPWAGLVQHTCIAISLRQKVAPMVAMADAAGM